jgi:hypothetical protein
MILIVGSGVLFLVTDQSTYIDSSLGGALSIFGFILFIASVGGLLAILATRVRGRIDADALAKWGTTSAKGRWRYVRNFAAVTSIPIIALLGLFMFASGPGEGAIFSELVRNYIVVSIVILGLSIFAAVRMWDYYDRLKPEGEGEPHHESLHD